MKATILRYSSDSDSTLGMLFINNQFFCYTLEDEFRTRKVYGETRIPAGTYNLSRRKELTPLTKKYRNKYSWFKWHIWIENVPNFSGIYMHVGNKDDDTEGCVCVGSTANNNKLDDAFIGMSARTLEQLHGIMNPFLDSDIPCTLKIIDADSIDVFDKYF